MYNKCGLPGLCGKCYAGKRGRECHAGHYGYRAPAAKRQPIWGEYVRKPIPSDRSLGEVSVGTLGQLASRHPELADHLVRAVYDDGTPRQLSTLSLFFEDTPKAALNDRDNHRSLYVSGDTWEECLDALEALLADETGLWRPWKQGGKKK